MPATPNVFAKTEQEMWVNPFSAPKPARSMDSIIAELNQVRSEDARFLRERFFAAYNDITEFLTADRAERIVNLEAKREELVLAARKAGYDEFIMEKQTIMNSLQEHAKLKATSEAARNRLEQLQYEASQSNPKLMTRLEKLQQENAIRDAQEKAQSTAMAESLFAEDHNRLLPQLRELKAKHADATNAATTVAEEIERLQRLQ